VVISIFREFSKDRNNGLGKFTNETLLALRDGSTDGFQNPEVGVRRFDPVYGSKFKNWPQLIFPGEIEKPCSWGSEQRRVRARLGVTASPKIAEIFSKLPGF
jgi:hypothetical protein